MLQRMKRTISLVFGLMFSVIVSAQSLSGKLATAFQQFEKDAQLKSAIASLYVIDAKTGQLVFEKNATLGLAPASTQKVITAATAYTFLGKDFRYQTELGFTTNKNNENILYIKPGGDPTFGSWRWEGTKEENVIKKFVNAIASANEKTWSGLVVAANGWNNESIPDGWIWQDIGNYYGAGAGALNWRENQFDLILSSGSSVGESVKIISTKPALYNYSFVSMATAAGRGTGDNAYIYFPIAGTQGILRGTIPVGESRFVISGAMPAPASQFAYMLSDALSKEQIHFSQTELPVTTFDSITTTKTILHTAYSPRLDSIVYWFNKKSINLYGEALIKTMAYQQKRKGATEEGIELLKDFWKSKGIDETELNMVDGSGLSPLNRITTHAQVTILQHAQKQTWYNGFYHSLPEYNGMKMKSGTIRGVKGFTGYHTAKDGKEYIFSFLVNNYNGSSATLVQKMYKVLDVLK
jgi:serine-type D-Ala-D-Ala carboxypeptidase/endopeptidase (penicillin-binding protein 4)